MRTKKVKAAGRFGVRYGKKVRARVSKIEKQQRKKQTCPFCKADKVKRISVGIWFCGKCKKKFANSAFFVENKNA